MAATEGSRNEVYLNFGNDGRRTLDVFYTDRGTKLFVVNGVLTEELIDVPPPRSPTPPPRYCPPSKLQPASYIESTSTSPHEPYRCPEYEEITKKVAEAALEHYNNKHLIKYNMVKPLDCRGDVWASAVWYHSNFTAKPETSKDGDGDPSAKLFFAEMKVAGKKSRKKYLITVCRPVKASKATKLCEICEDEKLVHPTGRFRGGQVVQRDLRARRNGKFSPSSAEW